MRDSTGRVKCEAIGPDEYALCVGPSLLALDLWASGRVEVWQEMASLHLLAVFCEMGLDYALRLNSSASIGLRLPTVHPPLSGLQWCAMTLL